MVVDELDVLTESAISVLLATMLLPMYIRTGTKELALVLLTGSRWFPCRDGRNRPAEP